MVTLLVVGLKAQSYVDTKLIALLISTKF